MSNLMKGYPVGADLFHVDGKTYGWTDKETDRYNKNYSRSSKFLEHT
jgi:hypothetical protein